MFWLLANQRHLLFHLFLLLHLLFSLLDFVDQAELVEVPALFVLELLGLELEIVLVLVLLFC
jgi:hypothetical protein